MDMEISEQTGDIFRRLTGWGPVPVCLGTDGGAKKGTEDAWWGGWADSVQATYREATVGHASGDAR